MVIVEPSVIAAVSSASKFISDNGSGFKMYRVSHKNYTKIRINSCELIICCFKKKLKCIYKHISNCNISD